MYKKKFQFSILLNEWDHTHQWITVDDMSTVNAELSLEEARDIYNQLKTILNKIGKKSQ